MFETFCLGLHYLNDALRILNPFLFFGATCVWVKLYLSVQSAMSRNHLKQYCIEQQINYIANNRDIDLDYIESLRRIYSGFGDKK